MYISVYSPLVIYFLVFWSNPTLVCGRSSDTCDWVGSGLHTGVPKGVQPLYLRCTSGRIKWQYPRGALRVLLTPPLGTFQGCVRISKYSTGARLYLEGEKKLYPLYTPVPDGSGSVADPAYRCFVSRKGQAALYVEADPPVDVLRKDWIEFRYDLVAKTDINDDMEECRPCSDDEILRAYCTSNFMVQGTVTSLDHNTTTLQSELTILATRARQPIPLEKGQMSVLPSKYVKLYRPLKCGTKPGHGEFVFLGRYKLGLPIVTCAPRLSHWKEIRQRALQSESNACQLD